MSMSEVTHARVKFFDDKVIKVVPINSIVEFQAERPKDINDFERNSRLYDCLWKDDKNPEQMPLPVQFSDLAVIKTKEQLEEFENKRGVFQSLNDTVIEEYFLKNTQSDEDKDVANKVKRKVKAAKIAASNNKLQKAIIKQKIESLQAAETLHLETNKASVELNNFPSTSTVVTKSVVERCNNEACSDIHKKYEFLQKNFDRLQSEHRILKNKFKEINETLQVYKCLNEKLQFQCVAAEKQLLLKQTQSQERRTLVTATDESQILLEQDNADIPCKTADNMASSTPKKYSTCQLQNYATDVTPKKPITQEKDNVSFQYESNDVLSPFAQHCASEKQNNSYQQKVNERKRRRLEYSDSEEDEETLPSDKAAVVQSKKASDGNKVNIHEKYENQSLDFYETQANDAEQGDKLPNKNNSNENLDNTENESTKTSKSKKRDKLVDEVNEEIFSNFRDKVKEMHDGEMKLMIYLNKDFKIPYEDWKSYKEMSASLFTKRLFRDMYTYPEEVAKRCVVESDAHRTPKGRHKRKAISPIKTKTLERCLMYYHLNKGVPKGKKLQALVAKKNHYLTEDINKAIQQIKK